MLYWRFLSTHGSGYVTLFLCKSRYTKKLIVLHIRNVCLNKQRILGVKQLTFLMLYKSRNILFQQLALNNNQKQNQRPICRDYQVGNCRRDSCRFVHLDNREFWRSEFDQGIKHSRITAQLRYFYITSYLQSFTFDVLMIIFSIKDSWENT